MTGARGDERQWRARRGWRNSHVRALIGLSIECGRHKQQLDEVFPLCQS